MKSNAITFVMILVGAAWLAMHASSAPPWNPVSLAGAALAVVGLLLVLVARVQLGRSFSVSAQAKKLVTTGLYSRIRNPIYLFGAICLAGVVIAVGRPILLLVLVALIPMQVVRARKEAQVLTEAFGDEYRRYRAQTWF
jgi:protein-S-isoprenylcysteine O-methyltransferase Ste14